MTNQKVECILLDMDSDSIREKILEALYRIHNKARGKKSLLVGIRDLTQEVKKDLPKVKENEVFSNTRFLIENDFVKEEAIENYFANKFGNSKPSYKYCLTKEGLAYFEHGSKFDKSNIFAGIGDITGNGNNIIIGNQGSITNVTNSQFEEGHRLAEDLRRKVNALGDLSDEQKIDIQSDIGTVQAQLGKSTPDTGILQRAKDNLAFLADIATVAPVAINLFTWLTGQFKI